MRRLGLRALARAALSVSVAERVGPLRGRRFTPPHPRRVVRVGAVRTPVRQEPLVPVLARWACGVLSASRAAPGNATGDSTRASRACVLEHCLRPDPYQRRPRRVLDLRLRPPPPWPGSVGRVGGQVVSASACWASSALRLCGGAGAVSAVQFLGARLAFRAALPPLLRVSRSAGRAIGAGLD